MHSKVRNKKKKKKSFWIFYFSVYNQSNLFCHFVAADFMMPRDSQNSVCWQIPRKLSIFLSIQCTWTSLEIKLTDPVNSVRLLTRGNTACKAVVLLQNSLPMIVSQCILVSSLNGTIHVSILPFMFVHSFLNKQLDSIVSYFPQRVLVLHA